MSRDVYMRTLMKMILSRKEKAGIEREILDCIEDLTEKYIEQGLSLKEAEEEAIRQMGDPMETAEMFNNVYAPRFEWRVPIYMIIWIVMVYCFKWAITISFNDPETLLLCTFAGVFLIIAGVALSYSEKSGDYPFLWWKKVPAKNWAIPGLGVFGNSCSIAGIGIALLAVNISQVIILYGIISIMMLFQRLFIENEQSKMEHHYLYKECEALESFDYRGRVYIGTEKHRVQVRKGQQVKKGDYLIVTGTKGFALIVEKM